MHFTRSVIRATLSTAFALSFIVLASTPREGRAQPPSYLVLDINPGPSSSYPTELVKSRGTLLFSAQDNLTGRTLWQTDGLDTGTLRVTQFTGANPRCLTDVNGTLYFSALDAETGEELWIYDNTTTGPVRQVMDLRPGSKGSHPAHLHSVDGQLLFVADDGSYGRELWVSIGSPAGTHRLSDFNPLTGDSIIREFALFSNELFFRVDTEDYGMELWRSNGSVEGTALVRDIRPGTGGSYPLYVTAGENAVFFRANEGVDGYELWKTNGSEAGTQQVLDIRPGSPGSLPRNLTYADGLLFFHADDGVSGRELWKSDGSTTGTRLVKDIAPGVDSSNPYDLFPVDDRVFFKANRDESGHDLWVSDGTAAGTVLVGRFLNVPPDPNPRPVPTPIPPYATEDQALPPLAAVRGFLVFQGYDSEHGVELWRSNGTPEGTSRLTDVAHGFTSSYPEMFFPEDWTLFFSADDGAHGRELWRHSFDPDVELVTPSPANFFYTDTPTSGPLSIHLRNDGWDPLKFQTPAITIPDTVADMISLDTTWSPDPIAAAETGEIRIIVTMRWPGTRTATFTIHTNDPDEPSISVTVITRRLQAGRGMMVH